MKKRLTAFFMASVCMLSLTSCSDKYPTVAVDGTQWDKNWTILGSNLGIEAPKNDLTLLENPVVLTGDDTYYATWIIGDPIDYTNSDGDDTELYQAELYVLLYGCADEASAQEAVTEWSDKEKSTYTVKAETEQTINKQTYSIFTYDCGSDTNPYSRGISAFAVYENYAVSMELTCLDTFTGDEQTILTDFLAGCHYAQDAN